MKVFAALLIIAFGSALTTSSPLKDFGVTECQDSMADVVFVLDSSASIWEPDFDRQVDFVKNIVKQFKIGPNNTQVGIVTFGQYHTLRFHLNKYHDSEELQKAIGWIRFKPGRTTNTGDAITYMSNEMFKEENGARENFPKVAVVITDGKSTETKKTIEAARVAREMGIHLFAIGVGKKYDRKELENIANKPSDEYVFTVDNYSALKNILNVFAVKTCQVTTTPKPTTTTTIATPTTTEPTTTTTTEPTTTTFPHRIGEQSDHPFVEACNGKPADVYFVMDSSRSIGSSNYQKQKTFVSKLLSAFDISNSKTRIGVVTYSNDVKVDIPLGSIATLPELQKAVDNLPYHARGTNTGDAIHFVRKVGFVKGVSRPEVAHIMIVLTDGLSMDSEKTRKESSLAHDAGIYVFAIGIGKGVDTVELSAIASNPDKNFLFHVENFDALSSIRTLLATRTCEVLPKDEAAPSSVVPLPKYGLMDIVFVYDVFGIGAQKTLIINKFISSIVRRITTGMGDIWVGRLIADCPEMTHNGLVPVTSWNDNSKITFPGLGSLIEKLDVFFSSNGGRYNARRTVVVFVDEQEQNVMDVVAKLHSLQNMNVITIILGEEEKYVLEETSTRKYFYVPSYNELLQFTFPCLKQLCFCDSA